MRDKKKVIIIGAGPSGLTAGWELLKDAGSPYEVTLLEMSDAVGGMARTITHNGDIMDVGGHRFFSKEKAVLEWWKAVFERKKATEDLLLRQREVSIYYGSQFFDYPVTKLLEEENKCLTYPCYLLVYKIINWSLLILKR